MQRTVTTLSLTLPLHQAQTVHLLPTEPEKAEREEVIVSSEPGNPATSTQFRYTLLVVEDNAEMNKFLVRQLSESYKVLTAANGVEALKILQESIINLIISDVMMPEMDGLELCDTVKTELDYSHIPIILLTAKTTLQSRIDGLKAGADAYIETFLDGVPESEHLQPAQKPGVTAGYVHALSFHPHQQHGHQQSR